MPLCKWMKCDMIDSKIMSTLSHCLSKRLGSKQVWVSEYQSYWRDQRKAVCIWINLDWYRFYVALPHGMTGFMASRYEFQDIPRIELIKWRLYVYKWITWNYLHWYYANFCGIALEMIRSTCRRYENCMGMTKQSLQVWNWGRDKVDAISQTTFSSAFSWMKMFELRLKFHWSLFLRVQLTIFQHWFR